MIEEKPKRKRKNDEMFLTDDGELLEVIEDDQPEGYDPAFDVPPPKGSLLPVTLLLLTVIGIGALLASVGWTPLNLGATGERGQTLGEALGPMREVLEFLAAITAPGIAIGLAVGLVSFLAKLFK